MTTTNTTETITASDVLDMPAEALVGLHTDSRDDEPSACWRAIRLMARGEDASPLLWGDLYATSSRWTGRRLVVSA